MAPAATDNGTVILWAVGILVIGFIAVAKFLFDRINENEKRCKAEAERAREDRDKAQAEITNLYKGVIHDQQQTQVQANSAMTKLADAVEGLNETVKAQLADEETRQHRKRAS
jgi:uncharacterized membrane protein YvbJ